MNAVHEVLCVLYPGEPEGHMNLKATWTLELCCHRVCRKWATSLRDLSPSVYMARPLCNSVAVVPRLTAPLSPTVEQQVAQWVPRQRSVQKSPRTSVIDRTHLRSGQLISTPDSDHLDINTRNTRNTLANIETVSSRLLDTSQTSSIFNFVSRRENYLVVYVVKRWVVT